MYGGIGVSASSLHRESTDSLIYLVIHCAHFSSGILAEKRHEDELEGWQRDMTPHSQMKQVVRYLEK